MTRRLAPAALAAILCLPCLAGGRSLDEYLAHGYGVVRATAFAGEFLGCRRDGELVFEDGSRLLCGRTTVQIAHDPRVLILARSGSVPSVVLIGSLAVPGRLSRLGTRVLARPLPVAAAPFEEALPPDPARGAPGALTAIRSLNDLQTVSPWPALKPMPMQADRPALRR